MCWGTTTKSDAPKKSEEAPLLVGRERGLKSGAQGLEIDTSSKEEIQDAVPVNEVRVKALAGNATQLRGTENKGEKQKTANTGKSMLLKAVGMPGSSVGALATLQQPALFVKPAAEIMRPLVLNIIQESEELSKVLDPRKDVVVSFMEQCREGVPDTGGRNSPPLQNRMREIEETSVRVFETLANRAQLLVDTLTKSPPEFWKVWSTFFPALTDFSESSPIFDNAGFFFKKLGDLMREADPPLTQQLIMEVGLPSLAKELLRSPEKRDALCEIIYCYTQEDTLNHLLVLRALKDKVRDDLPCYVSCLSCLVSIDAQLSLLDEHLLDLYIYYALVAMQSPQPKIRVAGISILSTITMCSSQHQSIVALIPSIGNIANDDWWEVQAQLIMLCANLLSKVSMGDRQDSPLGDDHDGSAASRIGDTNGEEGESSEDTKEQLLSIISRLFVVSGAKHVLQVGLSALVHLLQDYDRLLPVFVAVLLGQTAHLRRRLLRPPENDGIAKFTYVMGNASRMYEEKCISSIWPHLDVAKTLSRQMEASALERFETEHIEVFVAALPESFADDEVSEWLAIFDKVKQFIFMALIDSEIHLLATQIIKKFWLCQNERIATRTIEASKKNLIQAWQMLYGRADQVSGMKINEDAMLEFLRDLSAQDENVKLEITTTIESFKEIMPEEYKSSQLGSLLR